MQINKKNYLSLVKVSFIMLLFVICLTIHVIFCSAYNRYELSDNAILIEIWTNTESVVVSGDGDNTTHSKASFLSKNNFYYETITKNIATISMIAVIPEEISLYLFLVIVFFFFFMTLFTLLPDRWTLINQKVRLDN